MTALENALPFSSDDLAENRHERLSERQQSRLALHKRLMKGGGLMGGLLTLSVFLVFVGRFAPLVTYSPA
jgi:hypothetical protein